MAWRKSLDLFNKGMDRKFKDILPVEPPGINLGAGHKTFFGFDSLQLPDWDAEKDPLPHSDGSKHAVIALHFFEHVTPARIPFVMGECERVLIGGGTLNIVVPHRLGGMAWQDLDHKSFFTEDTWRVLFNNDYYERPGQPQFTMRNNFNLIMGESERTLALVSQFVKES